MDRIEYAEPMDSIDPSERIDRIDRDERRLRKPALRELSTVAITPVYHSRAAHAARHEPIFRRGDEVP